MAGLSMQIKKRTLAVLIIFSVLMILLIVRSGYIQIVQGEYYQKQAFEQQMRDRNIPPKRGIIYDRNMKPLAYSASVERVTINPKELRDSVDDLEKAAAELAEILDLKAEEVLNKMKKNTLYQDIKRKIEKETGDQVRKWIDDNNIHGVYVDEDTKRFYPYGNLAAHVIGFTGIDNQGLDGIEAIMEEYLKGYPGKILSPMDARNQQLPFGEERHIDARDGLNVVLTIDEVIQHFATKALDKAIVDNKVLNGATAIVMDPRNGDILAMVSKPDFNLNDPWAAPVGVENVDPATWTGKTEEEVNILRKNVWRNKAVVDTYEPGSTFKAITSAIALEEGVVTPDTPTNDFPVKVAGHTINCWRGSPHGNETFAEGVMFSCNPVFVKAAQLIGIDKFYKYLRAFGFYEKTGIGLSGEASGYFHTKPTEIDMATASFGQSFTITPIELIQAYAAIANGGTLIKPRLVKEIVDSEGNVVESFEPQVVRQVISKKTSDTMKEILESVVSKGTGKNAYIPGYRVAGKTGTSETVESRFNKSNRKIASFSSFAPADNPVICVLVVLDYPTGPFGHMGGVIAAPVAREIIEDTLDYLQVEKRYTEEELKKVEEDEYVPELRGMTVDEARKALAKLGFKYKIEGEDYSNDTAVVEQIPKMDVKLPKNSVIILYTYDPGDDDKVKMPNILNMTVQEASDALNKVGLNIKIVGSGQAIRQQYEPGTEILKGEAVEVEFRTIDRNIIE